VPEGQRGSFAEALESCHRSSRLFKNPETERRLMFLTSSGLERAMPISSPRELNFGVL
jgi:gentisate 1,2-dioxygenase